MTDFVVVVLVGNEDAVVDTDDEMIVQARKAILQRLGSVVEEGEEQLIEMVEEKKWVVLSFFYPYSGCLRPVAWIVCIHALVVFLYTYYYACWLRIAINIMLVIIILRVQF